MPAYGAPRATSVPRFSHAILIVFENRSASAILGNPRAPELNTLARRYVRLANYDAVAHPSLPNYMALISGTTTGFRNDCVECVTSAPTIADALTDRRMTWKAYVEGVQRHRFARVVHRDVKVRIPFLYANEVIKHHSQLDRLVPMTQFASDLANAELPTFSLVVPNLCHDMHNCSIATGDTWLRRFLQPLLPRLGRRDVVFVVFDEGYRRDHRGGGGRVFALAAGPLAKRGEVSRGRYNHYSLLRTLEASWHLPRLGRSATARPITGIWR